MEIPNCVQISVNTEFYTKNFNIEAIKTTAKLFFGAWASHQHFRKLCSFVLRADYYGIATLFPSETVPRHPKIFVAVEEESD